MQRGEGLHVLNLVAANYSTALIYDRATLDTYAGRDLPGAGPTRSRGSASNSATTSTVTCTRSAPTGGQSG